MRHQQNGILYGPYTYEACIYEQSIHERFIYEPSVYEPRRTFTAGGREEAEMRLYRLLGVKRFRRFVFALEAGKHRRDGGRNANYHLADLSCAGMRRHFAFLSYNAIIHIAGLLLAVLLILAKAFVLHKWRPVDWGIPAAVLLNIYCIMLQRYNSLRIRKALRTRQKIRGRRIRKNALLLVKSRPAERTAGDSVFSERDSNPQDHDCGPEEWTPGTDIVFLQDLKTAIREGRDFVVREEDAETIGRLADWACRAGVLCEKNGRDNPSIGKTFGEEAGKEPARGEKNDGAGLYLKASKAPKTLKASEVSKVPKASEISKAPK
ncbi:MAG: hypothetical protein Q4D81_08470, partial [Eubacteriales bacterium]|nr:hypothetical protein [Eubacteriales bacterium]